MKNNLILMLPIIGPPEAANAKWQAAAEGYCVPNALRRSAAFMPHQRTDGKMRSDLVLCPANTLIKPQIIKKCPKSN